jgi:hypothetical protein
MFGLTIRAVETGLTNDDAVEILEGIDDHTPVIGESSGELNSGAPVRVSKELRASDTERGAR